FRKPAPSSGIRLQPSIVNDSRGVLRAGFPPSLPERLLPRFARVHDAGMQTERWEQHGHTIAPRGRNRDVLVQSYGNILSEAGCERNFDRDTSFPLTPGARAASRRRRQLGAVYEGHSVPSRSTPCTPKRPRKN